MHLKSLDHQGIQIKSNDKRNLSAKHLVDVIKTKHEEQRRARIAKGKPPRFQFAWSFADQDVILDLLRLMIMYALSSGQHSATEKERILEFFETFIPQFFELPEDKVQSRVGDIDRDSAEEEVEEASPAELTNGRSRRNGKKGDLLRGVLDPSRNGSSSKSRKEKEDSAASGSKETTPDVGSANEEEMADAPEETAAVPDVSNDRWLPTIPGPTVVAGENPLLEADGELKADAFFSRPWYNFFCNQTIFVFFSVFQKLYERLRSVKESSASVYEEIRRERAEKPAKQLAIVHEEVNYFEDTNAENFWPRTVELVEDYINGEIDENRYQDVLRHYYLKNGWTLYTISDLLKTLCRLSLVCNISDNKEKTPDLIQQYLTSRQQEETSYQTEINSRKFADKCIKDGEMFVICWVS
ncbi:MAG: hypothetical protein OK454_01645 [Thaumarchaeota archaeon]|nr:hypothetical protein [Nitrososphaerota archaeon]